MALRNKGCCGSGNNCSSEPCHSYASSIIYDGESIPEAGVRHGDTLSNVIANMASHMFKGAMTSGEVNMESFQGLYGIRLSKYPTEIIQVSYNGAVMPPEFYNNDGKILRFCDSICSGDGLGSTQVIYKSKPDTAIGVGC